MKTIIDVLPNGWSIDISSHGSFGFLYNLYKDGIIILTCYDYESFIKHASISLTEVS